MSRAHTASCLWTAMATHTTVQRAGPRNVGRSSRVASAQSTSSSFVTAPAAPSLLTTEEAAAMLGIGRTTLHHLVWSGKLSPVRIGRSGRFDVRITGLVFVGTRATADARADMADFVRNVLRLAPAEISSAEADFFELAGGSTFAIAAADGARGERTVGFRVEDLDRAVAELRAADVEVDNEIASNERFRYVRFRAPDGHLYELLEVRSG